MLSAYSPIHGVLLTEGEDISAAFRPNEPPPSNATKLAHSSDSTPDVEKDVIEFALVQYCLQSSIPLLAICRGCQVVNLAAGGDLFPDLETIMGTSVCHIDYGNYDAHRHPVEVVHDTPLFEWFDGLDQLNVNSYHHQGIRNLADRFMPMAFAPDGLVEAYFDPECYQPNDGKFIVGLQFHPERMVDVQKALSGNKFAFDYPGCSRPYEEFVLAATAYCRRSAAVGSLRSAIDLKGRGRLNMNSNRAHACPQSVRESKRITDDLNNCVRQPQTCEARSLQSGVLKLKHSFQIDDIGVSSRRSTLLGVRPQVSKYSKEELGRLYRSGASVHGTRLVYSLIHGKDPDNEENENENNVSKNNVECKTSSSWKRVEQGLLQVEKGLKGLECSLRLKEALDLMQKLSASFASLSPPQSG